jgi:hypothetical protein
VVQVPDVGALFEAFAAGMRAVHGKLLIKGLPRMDPAPARAATTKLGKAMENAVVLADSHGEVGQALKILEGALTRERATASAEDLVQAEAYRDELRERAS